MKRTMLFVTIACASPAANGSAQPSPVPEEAATEQVSYADLNLGSAKDQARLDWRIRSAASRLCTEDDRATPTYYVNSGCFSSAMAKANEQRNRAIARAVAAPAIALSGAVPPQPRH